MGQQSSFTIPVVKNSNPINFSPQTHQFESNYVQRVKQTPFVGSILYSSQPLIYIQPAEMTMQMLVAPRLNTTKLFPKQQIFKIIENTFAGLLQLKTRGFQHYGNISLASIFYHKQSKTFKIINPAFFNSTNFLLAKQGLKFSFLAPQQLLSLTSEEQPQKSFKTDIFVLVVCLLQICTLSDSSYNIFDVEIKERLKNIDELYSPELANFFELCLEYEMQKRIDLENAIKQIRFLKQKDRTEQPKAVSQPQIPAIQMLSPRGQPKKGTLPFGPGHLPKKLPQQAN